MGHGTWDMPAPCASTRINEWCRVCFQVAYLRWSHICSLWTFFLCEGSKSSPAQTTRPRSFFHFSTKRSVPYRCVYWVTPFFPFRPTKRQDSQSILLSAPPFLIEPCPRFLLQPTAPIYTCGRTWCWHVPCSYFAVVNLRINYWSVLKEFLC